jgi:hypothetical protein
MSRMGASEEAPSSTSLEPSEVRTVIGIFTSRVCDRDATECVPDTTGVDNGPDVHKAPAMRRQPIHPA